MLLAILGANVGGEVSAFFLQKCVQEWHQLWTAGAQVGDKRTNNVLLLLSYMYHFKVGSKVFLFFSMIDDEYFSSSTAHFCTIF